MKLTHLLSTGLLATAVATTAFTAPHLTAGGPAGKAAALAPAVGALDRPTVTSPLSNPDRGSNSGQPEGATVVMGFPCGIPVPGVGAVATTNSHSVITPSGNAALSCHASTPIVVPQTLVFKDLPCGTLESASTDSHLVVTDTGRVNFWCHHHK